MPENAAVNNPPPSGPLRAFTRPISGSFFRLALFASALLWASQPPLGLDLLAWVAPAPWLLIVQRGEIGGPRGWLKLWLAGALYWAAAVYWIALPHPLTPIGLVFLAAYLGCYLPAFVWLSRAGTRRARLPLWLAAPIAWTALEWVQSHLFSGFLMGALSHTQAWRPGVIQIAAWVGAYGVSFAMMMLAAGLVDGIGQLRRRRSPETVPLDNRPPIGFFAAALPLAIVCYAGHYAALAADRTHEKQPKPTLALIQGDVRALWDADPNRAERVVRRHAELSLEAVKKAQENGQKVDLLIWPESMFLYPLLTVDDEIQTPEGLRLTALIELGAIARSLETPMLVGLARFDASALEASVEISFENTEGYNSALLVDSVGRPLAVYDKMHRVPFGEYIPLFEDWSAMAYLTPMPGGTKPGRAPVAMPLDSQAAGRLTLSPSICYETVIPHVLRRQVAELQDAGTPPDLLVNVTNNAWFWGSSELEMHLACNIFRCVENRTPMVIAANGGLSAVIDSAGRVLEVSDRQTEQVIIADVPLDPRVSFYTRRGDLLAWGCLIVCVATIIIGFFRDGRREEESREMRPSDSSDR